MDDQFLFGGTLSDGGPREKQGTFTTPRKTKECPLKTCGWFRWNFLLTWFLSGGDMLTFAGVISRTTDYYLWLWKVITDSNIGVIQHPTSQKKHGAVEKHVTKHVEHKKLPRVPMIFRWRWRNNREDPDLHFVAQTRWRGIHVTLLLFSGNIWFPAILLMVQKSWTSWY